MAVSIFATNWVLCMMKYPLLAHYIRHKNPLKMYHIMTFKRDSDTQETKIISYYVNQNYVVDKWKLKTPLNQIDF